MTTITLQVPDDIYNAARDEAARSGTTAEARIGSMLNFAHRALLDHPDLDLEESDYKLTQEDLEAIGQGIADSDAGLYSDGDDFFARLYTERGWPLNTGAQVDGMPASSGRLRNEVSASAPQ